MSDQWYYASFATDDGFLGGLYMRSSGNPVSFSREAWRRGLNPGGQMALFGPISDEDMDGEGGVPDGDRYRLLSKEDIGEGMTLGELEDLGLA